MKIRNGFVSNSSSSSFIICNIKSKKDKCLDFLAMLVRFLVYSLGTLLACFLTYKILYEFFYWIFSFGFWNSFFSLLIVSVSGLAMALSIFLSIWAFDRKEKFNIKIIK